MNPFALSGILAGVSSFFFGLLVLFKSSNKKLGKVWFLFALSVALWGLGVLVIPFFKDPDTVLIAWKLTWALGANWIAVLFYHFVSVFCGLNRPRFLLSQYLVAAAFFFITPTDLIYSGVIWVFNSFYYSKAGSLYILNSTWWLSLVAYSHYELLRAFKASPPIKRNQIKYFFLATAVGFSGGSFCFLPPLGIDLYPWGNFTIFLYPLIMSYAILKYRLMDITIALRRASLIAVIYIGLAGLLVPVVWSLYPTLVSSRWGFPLGILLCGAFLSTGPFMYAYLIKKSAFFQEKVVAGVTHEFKSPLAAIQSATAVLRDQLEKLPEGIRAKQADYLLMIQNNTQRLEKFIQDLLEVAKIEETRPELKKEEVDLNEVCERVVRVYGPRQRRKD